MIMEGITEMISTLGYPIGVSIILFFGIKYMLDSNNKNIERLFEMYKSSNEDNRKAIEECTRAVDKLCNSINKTNRHNNREDDEE